jgi:glycosyltransferase involved in cell wall biosynthesis
MAPDVRSSPAQVSDISVVVCAYTEDRWADLQAAVRSIEEQTVAAKEIVVVIDENPELLRRVEDSMPNVFALPNTGIRGAGGARNCGVAASSGSVIAFLDDDALAARDWIERATLALDDPGVIGVGGTIEPAWDSQAPNWMAEEFYWTLGCTYPGLPASRAPVRNLIATNMFVRRSAFLELGGFRMGWQRLRSWSSSGVGTGSQPSGGTPPTCCPEGLRGASQPRCGERRPACCVAARS